jgi:hypothetical protein
MLFTLSVEAESSLDQRAYILFFRQFLHQEQIFDIETVDMRESFILVAVSSCLVDD